jgi:predicted Zn-dependent protease
MSLRRVRRHARWLAVGCALALAPAVAHGKKKDPKDKEEVDHVELAALLLRDGHYDRAELTLRQVDLKVEGVDLIRFHTLSGLIFLHKQLYAQAKESFEAAVKAGQTDSSVYLSLAQAEFGLKNYQAAILALDRAGPAAEATPAAFALRAEAHFNLEQVARGFAALNAGAKKFPADRGLARTRLFRFVEQGLYQEVVSLGEAYFKDAASPEDYLALGEALRKSGQLRQAAELAEQARLRYPGSKEVTLLLAHVYLDHDHALSAAMLLEDLAREHPEFTSEAAELYRRAGRFTRSLMLNARVLDQPKKLKQRLSILVEMQQFESVVAMAPRLARLDMLGDENIRYALAYGYYKIGEFARAEEHLRALRTSEMFERANQLRMAMEACKGRGWECG